MVEVVYEQDFEALIQANPNALGTDGWLFFVNVFDENDLVNPKFSYPPNGPEPAPNSDRISKIASGEGGLPQGTQQLEVFSDYTCCALGTANPEGHGNGTDRVEVNVFQEINPIPAAFVGKTLEFRFDAKGGNIGGATTALAFIKTLDPGAGFSLTNFETEDTTNLQNWSSLTISLLIDPGLEGQILQVGFSNTASNFDPSGVFYDNVLVVTTE